MFKISPIQSQTHEFNQFSHKQMLRCHEPTMITNNYYYNVLEHLLRTAPLLSAWDPQGRAFSFIPFSTQKKKTTP